MIPDPGDPMGADSYAYTSLKYTYTSLKYAGVVAEPKYNVWKGRAAPRCNGGRSAPHAQNIYKIIPTLKIVQRARQPRLPVLAPPLPHPVQTQVEQMVHSEVFDATDTIHERAEATRSASCGRSARAKGTHVPNRARPACPMATPQLKVACLLERYYNFSLESTLQDIGFA